MCIAAAIAGGAAVTAGASIYAGNKAAGAQSKAAGNASAAQQAMYEQTRSDLAPYRGAGSDALSALESFYGIGGKSPGDWQKTLSGLPGYQFQLQQGTKGVDQNLAARGLLQSGAAGKALTQYGQGLASNYADKYTSGLAGIANMGENAGAQTGALGANAANGQAQNSLYAGNAQANNAYNTAGAIGYGLNGLNQGLNYYQGAQQQQIGYDQASVNAGVGNIYNNLGSYGLT